MTSWEVIRRCHHCDNNGMLPDRTECAHQEVYVAAAEKGAAAARAAIRPAPPERTPA